MFYIRVRVVVLFLVLHSIVFMWIISLNFNTLIFSCVHCVFHLDFVGVFSMEEGKCILFLKKPNKLYINGLILYFIKYSHSRILIRFPTSKIYKKNEAA